jgi:hypothetical protein
LWHISWIVVLLGVVGFGVLRVRHPEGVRIVVPASAPLIDHIVQVLALVCIAGGCAIWVTWKVALSTHERRVRRQDTGH